MANHLFHMTIGNRIHRFLRGTDDEDPKTEIEGQNQRCPRCNAPNGMRMHSNNPHAFICLGCGKLAIVIPAMKRRY